MKIANNILNPWKILKLHINCSHNKIVAVRGNEYVN